MGIKGFVEGGIASVVAGSLTHPLDLIKVRMQLQGETTHQISNPHHHHHHLHFRPAFAFISPSPNLDFPQKIGPLSVGINIVRSEGLIALFSGVSASVLRQTLYSSTSMGLYNLMKEKWSDPDTGRMPLMSKILSGLIAGGIGASVGNPADVAMVRMQADGRLPYSQRRNYNGAIDAIMKISRQEGISSLWRGSSLTVKRAMIVNAAQLASYDQIKETILAKGLMKDGIGTHIAASIVAGFMAAMASTPVDVIKTRIMNMKVEPGKASPYSGALDCAIKTVRAEGVMALYKGFVPIITRQGPFTMVLFVTLELVRKLLKDF